MDFEGEEKRRRGEKEKKKGGGAAVGRTARLPNSRAPVANYLVGLGLRTAKFGSPFSQALAFPPGTGDNTGRVRRAGFACYRVVVSR